MKRKYCPDLVTDGAACDANYIRLSRLLSAADPADRVELCVPAGRPGAGQFVFTILERCPYTTILEISHTVQAATGVLAPTNRMEVRMYHDLKTAEVSRVTGCVGRAVATSIRMSKCFSRMKNHRSTGFWANYWVCA